MRSVGAERRRATFARGVRAEGLALAYLMLKGYRPVARRYAAAGGEVDLIVTRGDTVAFVEVKTRSHMEDALTAITPTKRRRFSRAVRSWLARNPWAAGKTWRADAIFVAPWRLPRYLPGAFEIEMP
jgi:putative endonuclease